jgi:hypothetical protein
LVIGVLKHGANRAIALCTPHFFASRDHLDHLLRNALGLDAGQSVITHALPDQVRDAFTRQRTSSRKVRAHTAGRRAVITPHEIHPTQPGAVHGAVRVGIVQQHARHGLGAASLDGFPVRQLQRDVDFAYDMICRTRVP